MTKKIFAVMLGLFIGALPSYIYAQEALCGADAVWNYNNGVLTISGNGKISDYENGKNRPWDSYAGEITKLVIESGITEIGDWTFCDFEMMTEVKLPETLKTIGERAFYSCPSLSYIKIPDNVEIIEDGAFNSCTAITRVDLSNSLKTIGNSAFMNLPELTAVVFPEKVDTIGKWAFFGCSSLKGIYFEGTVPSNPGAYMLANTAEDYMVFTDKAYALDWEEKKLFPDEHTYLYDKSKIIPLYINNKRINFDQQPIIKDGRTLVPVRAIFEAMGAVVGWDDITRTVVAERNGTIIKIGVDNTTMYKNDTPITIDVPAVIENSRTLVPARAISEAFGAEVKWNDTERTVYITIND